MAGGIFSSKNVILITLGCPKNQADSDVLAGNLESAGIRLVDDAVDADTIVINTCGFIEDAKAESIETILEATRFKKSDPAKKVFVWGCLSARYEAQIKQEIPEVDGYFGVESFPEIIQTLTGSTQPIDSRKRSESELKHSAYLKIADGCDHSCTFCAIPLFKGKYRSRPVDELVEEAKALSDRGVRELILVAQDSTAYGRDRMGGADLTKLLRKLTPIPGIDWIRLMYAHPLHVTDELIRVMAQEDKICKYLDLPLQHIVDPLLKAMKRGIDRAKTESLIHRLREGITGLTLRTAFILGFPGETEPHFEQLLSFVRETEFERLGAFIYSSEEGTAAFSLSGVPDRSVAEQRYNELMDIQQDISEAKNADLLDKKIAVLVDGYDSDQSLYYGRTEGDAPDVDQTVWIEGHADVGHIQKIKIVTTSAYDLVGTSERTSP